MGVGLLIPSEVRCVQFDAVGTLIYADPPVSAVYMEAANEFGLLLDEGTVRQRFAAAFNKYNADTEDGDARTSDDNERDRWRAIVAAAFSELADTEALFSRLWDHFAQPSSWRLYDDVADCCARLRHRGLWVGVASNFDQRLFDICSGLSPLDGLEKVFVSSRIGFRKPAMQFFRAIEEATALRADELMLVGDDWKSDYLGATAAGWQAVYLDRGNVRKAANSIQSLADLG
jgi:putative hydrolase of the HAD superfamily